MKERKNIDRLFQEKFKDFEAHPSDRVWENIASAKAKKEDSKLFPLWLRLGGIAAALAILFSVGSVFWNAPENDTQLVENEIPVQTEETDSKKTPRDRNTTNEIPENIQTQQLAEESTNETPTTPTNNEGSTKKIYNGNSQNRTLNERPYTRIAQQTGSKNARTLKETDNGYTETPSTSESTKNVDARMAVTTTPNKNTPDRNNRSHLIEPSQSDVKASTNKTQEAIAQQIDAPSKTEEKKSLVEVAEALKNAKEEEAIANLDKNPNQDRWNVGAVAAPVYYGNFGGSGIDPQFKDNTKSGDVNLSYGVQVSYAVSDRLKVRTGVSNVDLSYGTNDISFTPDIAATRLAGVAYNSNGKFLSVTDRVNQQEIAQSDFQGGGSNVSNGSINQRIGYIEIPVEAVYVLSDKRLGIEVIGGVSTLFVNDNEIAIESDGLRTPIGASSSLNDVSFTTNVGIGLNYKVTESVHINMEPTLKYQLNAFDNSAGDFKPYYVGLYTGVSYRF
ncbi:MAG: hypothetical protein ACI828_000118 [Flavobacteriales bacterium]|jgi:hypothetical protein